MMPHAFFHLYSKRGKSDCAIASMATIFRRDYEEVLIAASRASSTVWRMGLSCKDMSTIARRLKVKTKWKHNPDFEEDIGVLMIDYNDSSKCHAVVLIEGWIFDPEHNPIMACRFDEYYRAHNAYGTALLEVIE